MITPGKELCFPGELVALPVHRSKALLDGFYRPPAHPGKTLLILVHGMGSNFYRSKLKKCFLQATPEAGLGILTFNNRGAEDGTIHERFSDCLEDLDAAIHFGLQRGYRHFILAGHSTGCQKITYYQARRQRKDIAALVLLAPADDHALCRRDTGALYARWVARARRLVARGKGREILAGLYQTFSARRFLSVADPRQTEAKIFNYDGRLEHFRKIQTPMLAIFGSREPYAVLPVRRMLDILKEGSRSSRFDALIIPRADHSFHGHEESTVQQVLKWACSVRARAP